MLRTLEGYVFLGIFWLVAWIAISCFFRRKVTAVSFLVSERSVGFWLGSVSTAIAWVWAPALFISSQKAYEQGIPGLFWFTFPNAIALVLFSFLAARMQRFFPQGCTLPEFIEKRFDKRMQTLYVLTIFIVQSYAVILNLTAALLMLNLVTGISKQTLIVILGSMMVSLSLLKGIRSSLVEDVIKAGFIAVVALGIVPWTVAKAGGSSALAWGLGGSKGVFMNLFDPVVAWTFGAPISISLLSGVVIDQQQWQRALSIRSG
ncbi:MAG: hypothetical protein Q8Q97_02080, partial [bacterium]|nr:hypothetical protein [bacterium]